MKKIIFCLSLLFISFQIFAKQSITDLRENKPLAFNIDDPNARISCTISAQDEWGTTITYTASAGNIFMSAEEAGQLACKRAYAMLLADLTSAE